MEFFPESTIEVADGECLEVRKMDARKEGREINIFIPWRRHERQGREVGVI